MILTFSKTKIGKINENPLEIGELFLQKKNNMTFEMDSLIIQKEELSNQKNVSRISPYLHWGQISVNSIW